MKFYSAIVISFRNKTIITAIFLFTSIFSYSQTITINKQLFAGGTYRDSSNITVPIDINVVGTNGFGVGFNPGTFTYNYFKLAIIPVATANALITDTSDAAIINVGGSVIGKYTFSNFQVPYTTFVNGIIRQLGVGIISANYVLKVISINPFVVSDASVPITVQRINAPKVKSFAIANPASSTVAINYDPTHSAMFFGFCGAVVNSKGNPLDTSISLIDSTAGSFNTPASYDSVILVKNDFSTLVNTDLLVYAATVKPKSIINFPPGILKAGAYYTLILKAKDDSGYVSSKSYFVLNTFWNINLAKSSSPNGCIGDTISLFPEISNIQAGQQFGILNNFPGLLYNVNWGDPKHPYPINYSYAQLMNNNGIISYVYDTSSCVSPSHYWTITAKLSNPFQGYNCTNSIATPQVQIWSSVKPKFVHHQPVCIYDALDTTMITFIDSSYGGTNTNCTGNAYYIWSKAYVGCGNINNAVFTDVDSSINIYPNGNVVPNYVMHYNHKDTFNTPGKYMIQLTANNNTCLTNSYIDSITVVAPPHVNFVFDSAGIQKNTVTGCAPLTVSVNNLSDSTCTQKWAFKWDVTDTAGNIIPPGSVYHILNGYANTDSAPKLAFYQQGIFKLRLVGSNACTKQDTISKTVNVNWDGSVMFPNGNQPTSANGMKTNAFCIYSSTGKTVKFDSAIHVPASDLVMKPSYNGTPSGATPYTWTIISVSGTYVFNGGTTTSSPFPNITFNTPPNMDGDFKVYIQYTSTCGYSVDSFELFLNRQVIPKIIIPSKDTSVCSNTTSLQFTATIIAANGTNSGYNSVIWYDTTNIFGNGLSATWNTVATKTVTFKVYKPQPNGCSDTFVTRKITVLSNVTGRDTAFSICSGTQLNYNPGTTSSPADNTYTWNSSVNASGGPVTGNYSCSGPCKNITDVLISAGQQGEVDYVVTPTSANGCPGTPFTIRVTILPYPTVALFATSDTICSGVPSDIFVSDNTPGATYCWQAFPGTHLTPYNQSSWPPACNNFPSANGGPNLNIAYTNISNTIDSFKIKVSASVAGGTCASPKDSITIFVIPGPTQPIANLAGDSIYLCNQTYINLNANPPSALKWEVGTWSQMGLPLASISNANSPTATAIIAGNNVYTLYWTISSPLATALGCPALTDSLKIFDRPLVTKANVGYTNKDTILCNYDGLNWVDIHLKGNSDPTRAYQTGEWTISEIPASALSGTTFYFQNGIGTLKDTSFIPKDNFIFKGAGGNYTLIYSIKNDAGCSASTDTLKIDAGIGDNFILKDTAICLGSQVSISLTGSLPGSGIYNYQWYENGSMIVGANSQNYTIHTLAVTTSFYRVVTSIDCPSSNYISNIVTVKVNQPPAASLISTIDSSCAPFRIDASILRIDTINTPIDTNNVYTWFVNGVLSLVSPKFPLQGLYTINNPNDSAIIELRVSSKFGCGNTVSIKHTFYTKRGFPIPQGRDTAYNVCSGTQLNYNPGTTSSPANNTYTWNSSVNASGGPVTGNYSCSGPCKNITDVLISAGQQGEVDYVVTPTSANGCPGTPFTIRVTILPYPTVALFATSDTICSGVPSDIFVSDNTPGATYCWQAFPGTHLTPYHQSSWPPACNNIPSANGGPNLNIAYTNTNNTIDSFKIKVSVSVAGGTCASPPDSIIIYVAPAPIVPVAYAVNDTVNTTDNIQLIASPVTNCGYYWTGPNGFSSNLQNPVIQNATTLSEGEYVLSYTCNNISCPIAPDSVYIKVNSRFNIVGRAITPLGKPVNKAIVSTTGSPSSQYTDASGVFSLPLLPYSNPTFSLSKNNDIKKSNGVTTLDLAITQAHILGKSILNSPYKIIAADVNGDGKVSALDIVYIKRLILGIDTSFTGNKLWAFVDSSYKFPDTTNPFPFKDSISFTRLTANKSNQTFIACKLGDVNWDWNPAIQRPVLNNINPIELSYNPIKNNNTTQIVIPVKVKNFKDMLGMQFTISFNANVMQWQGLANNPLGIETGTTHAAEGSVTFLWVDAKNEFKTLEDGSVIIEMVFIRTGNCTNEQLELNSSITSIEAFDKDYNLHNIILNTSLINSIDIMKETWTVSPNPTTDGSIHVQMNLKKNKTIVFRLSDIRGKVLLLKQVEGIKGADNIILKEGNISAGTYFLQIIGLEGEEVKKIMVN